MGRPDRSRMLATPDHGPSRMTAKAAAAVALERAEAEGRRAVAELGRGSSMDLMAPPRGPLEAASGHVQLLRRSSELRRADEMARCRQGHEELFASFDRQLLEVQKTRDLIATALCGRISSSVPASRDSLVGQEQLPLHDSHSGGSTASRVPGRLVEPPALALREQREAPCQRVPVSRQGRTSPANRSWRTIELRPLACPPEVIGSDCACCLCPLADGQGILEFPCPSRHVFHAECLHRWLRSAGARTTCPVCRSWPGGGRKTPNPMA